MGMYFDAVVVEVKTFLLLFRLALAILWTGVVLVFPCFQCLLCFIVSITFLLTSIDQGYKNIGKSHLLNHFSISSFSAYLSNFVMPQVTQPMLQRRPNRTELRSMDCYIH